MNYLLHRQRTPGSVIPVPDQLKELMSEISREVLRKQPKNVVNFIADYLEAKLIRRENSVVANKAVDTVLDTSLDIIEMLDEIGLDEEKAERAVQLIREAFHKHFHVRTSDESLREAFREAEVLNRLVEECGFTESEALRAGNIIERAYKTYFLKNVYKEYHAPAVTSDWKEAAAHTLSIYAASGATKEEMERAAVRIQSAYRGYYTRKRQELDRRAEVIQKAYRKHQEKQVAYGLLDQIIDEVVEPKFCARQEVMRIVNIVLRGDLNGKDSEEAQKNEAAVKVQSVFRGNQIRKRLASDKIEHEVLKTPLEAQTDQPMTSDSGGNLEKAATLAQSVARGYLTRRQVRQEKAALQMQSLARGHLARKTLFQKQQGRE